MPLLREYVGRKSVEAANYDGEGNDLYSTWLTKEEIIRCRDCIYWVDEDFCNNPKWYQPHSIFRPCTDPDGFCAWGERGE